MEDTRDMLPPRPAALLAVVAALCLIGAPGRSAPDTPARSSGRRSDPRPADNYCDQVAKRATWPSFPLRVHFLRDDNYTEEREKAALAGLDRWVKATHSRVSYRLEPSRRDAQVIIRFDEGSDNGVTRTRFIDKEIVWAEMRVGVESDSSEDTACVAAHEFGHALGMDGHSDDSHDLMYATHRVGAGWRITDRDLNTLDTFYPASKAAEDAGEHP